MENNDDGLLGTKEACVYAGISRTQLYVLVSRGKITQHKRPLVNGAFYAKQELEVIKQSKQKRRPS